MSKRRGKVRVDALSEERRHWYSDLQEPGIKSFKEYEHVHQESKPVQNRHYYLDDDDDDSATGRVLALEDRAFNKYADVKPDVWIKSLNSVRSKTSVLICFHGVGNNHSYFKKWGKSLSTSGISLYSITVPGHMNRFNEPMSMSFVEMANFIYLSAKALRIMEGNDVILFGHCSGAIIAYEVARLMQKDGLSSLRQLIVSSAISPLVQTAYNKNKRGVIKYFLQSDKDLIERVKLMGGMVDDNFTTAPMNLMKHNLKMIRRDFLIQEKYLIHLMDDPLYDIGLHSHNTSAVVSSAVSVASAGRGSVGSAMNASSANHSFSGSVASGTNKNASNKATPNVSAKGSVNNSAANSIVHSNHNTGRAGSPAKSAAASQHNSAASSRFPSTTHTASSHNHHHNSSAASVSSGLKSHTGSFNGTIDDLDSAFSRGSKKKDDDSSSEEEEDFYIPPVLYKLRVPIATILAVDNQIVELKDVNAWSELTSSYNHIAIHDGGHNYLRLKENRTEVLGLIEKAFSNGQL